jgi:hypothetical protein
MTQKDIVEENEGVRIINLANHIYGITAPKILEEILSEMASDHEKDKRQKS